MNSLPFIAWNARTSEAERAAAMAILDTLRVEAIGPSSIRVVFSLAAGWDTG